METTEFIKAIKKRRLTGKWYTWSGMVNGKYLKLKGYGTWIQRIETTTWIDGSAHDMSVRDFNDQLKAWVE